MFLLLHYYFSFSHFTFFHLVFIISECWHWLALFRSKESATKYKTTHRLLRESKDGGRSRNINIKWNGRLHDGERVKEREREQENPSRYLIYHRAIYFNAERRLRSQRRRRLFFNDEPMESIVLCVCAHARRDGALTASFFALLRFIYFILLSWGVKKGREARRITNSKWYSFFFFFSSAALCSSWIYYYCYYIHISTQWASEFIFVCNVLLCEICSK